MAGGEIGDRPIGIFRCLRRQSRGAPQEHPQFRRAHFQPMLLQQGRRQKIAAVDRVFSLRVRQLASLLQEVIPSILSSPGSR